MIHGRFEGFQVSFAAGDRVPKTLREQFRTFRTKRIAPTGLCAAACRTLRVVESSYGVADLVSCHKLIQFINRPRICKFRSI